MIWIWKFTETIKNKYKQTKRHWFFSLNCLLYLFCQPSPSIFFQSIVNPDTLAFKYGTTVPTATVRPAMQSKNWPWQNEHCMLPSWGIVYMLRHDNFFTLIVFEKEFFNIKMSRPYKYGHTFDFKYVLSGAISTLTIYKDTLTLTWLRTNLCCYGNLSHTCSFRQKCIKHLRYE